MAGEEKTREVFGDYVSVYNFRQAIEDNATVPLYYEARIPELQLTNEDLADDLAAVIEEADLDEEQEKKLEREFARQYHLITREDRLDTIAADIVTHFLGLARGTKAMVVAIDKVTAVRMFDKVKAAWAKRRAELPKPPRASQASAAFSRASSRRSACAASATRSLETAAIVRSATSASSSALADRSSALADRSSALADRSSALVDRSSFTFARSAKSASTASSLLLLTSMSLAWIVGRLFAPAMAAERYTWCGWPTRATSQAGRARAG